MVLKLMVPPTPYTLGLNVSVNVPSVEGVALVATVGVTAPAGGPRVDANPVKLAAVIVFSMPPYSLLVKVNVTVEIVSVTEESKRLKDSETLIGTDPAWLGVPNAKLAISPQAAIKENDRLLIEYLRRSKVSLGKSRSLYELRRDVVSILGPDTHPDSSPSTVSSSFAVR